eukprot:TRINITY_DN4338_c0_g2_i1.p1 TRINITY_DN4338_c0_g2~~TRINITY_DN4338_c0_g2_i1.p1  ORF type:complete len:101 (-),score=11.74 TRINITY_DN4338_c0_g2_i1:694-996(-)
MNNNPILPILCDDANIQEEDDGITMHCLLLSSSFITILFDLPPHLIPFFWLIINLCMFLTAHAHKPYYLFFFTFSYFPRGKTYLQRADPMLILKPRKRGT